MITDEEIDNLPKDDEAAFVQFESIVRESLKKGTAVRDYRGSDAQREYVAHILAFTDQHSLPLELPRNPSSLDEEPFWDWYQDFVREWIITRSLPD